jgi:hypothetical protein
MLGFRARAFGIGSLQFGFRLGRTALLLRRAAKRIKKNQNGLSSLVGVLDGRWELTWQLTSDIGWPDQWPGRGGLAVLAGAPAENGMGSAWGRTAHGARGRIMGDGGLALLARGRMGPHPASRIPHGPAWAAWRSMAHVAVRG